MLHSILLGLSEVLDGAISNFLDIKWLDLSFNELTSISNELSQVSSAVKLKLAFR